MVAVTACFARHLHFLKKKRNRKWSAPAIQQILVNFFHSSSGGDVPISELESFDFAGETPLHFAKQNCDSTLVFWLLEAGVNANKKNRGGKTPRELKGGCGGNMDLFLVLAERGNWDSLCKQEFKTTFPISWSPILSPSSSSPLHVPSC
jgi:hypothetical protein